MTSTRKTPPILPRSAIVAVIVAGAGSFGLLLRAGSSQPSYRLIAIFTALVLSPFVALLRAAFATKGWTAPSRAIIYAVMLAIAVGSLAVYAPTVLAAQPPRAVPRLLMAPFVSWLLIAAGLIAARRRDRSRD